ncbi:MAG: hypothetical protein V3U67_00020 [Gemmatimonadota bacterium]
MKGVRVVARAFISGLVVLSAACAGEGTGLDEFGNPLTGGGGVDLGATFSGIQARVFTPICTQCHAGASAPLGFSLEAGVSFANVVNVPSVERPELMRVKPGQPDSSYLVLKVEGASGIVGARMPLGFPPLPAEEIAAIRDWITAGALEN